MFEGTIVKGGTIRLKSYLDDKRIFKLKVEDFDENEKLVWRDALGRRTFLLEPYATGTLLSMTETIAGPLFPLFASKIPSFDNSFEMFIFDLEQEALKMKTQDNEL